MSFKEVIAMGKSKARKPTREQKNFISAAGLQPEDWLVITDIPKCLHLVHRGTGTSRHIDKEPTGGRR